MLGVPLEIRRKLGYLVVLTSALATGAISAASQEDQPPGAKAREDVKFLVDGVESDFDCDIVLESLVTRLDAVAGHFTVMVRLDGSECEEAFRALQLRGLPYPFSFIALPESDDENIENQPGGDT